VQLIISRGAVNLDTVLLNHLYIIHNQLQINKNMTLNVCNLMLNSTASVRVIALCLGCEVIGLNMKVFFFIYNMYNSS